MSSSENTEAVYMESHQQTVDFYNQNHQVFESFEQKFGVNIWWLVHFRVYFALRDSKLRKNKSAQSETPQKRSSVSSAFNTLKELAFMFLTYRKPRIPEGVLVLNEPFRKDEGILGRLENDFNCIANREMLNPKKATPALKKFRSQTLSVDHLVVRCLLRSDTYKSLHRFNKALKNLFSELASSNSTAWHHHAILQQLHQSRFSLLIYYLRYLAFDKAFTESEVTAVLMQDENGPQQKVVQYAGRKHGIRVYAYQHGNIHRWNPAFNYSDYRNKPKLPDTTFVWGEHSKEMLTSWGGYPEESVAVTGRIKPLREKRTKNPILDQKKKIILYASQPLPDAQLRAQYLNDVILVAKKFEEEYQLVVRPHPAEMDGDYFRSAAKSLGYSDIILDRQSDLTTQLELCDVLITAFSTVGTEVIPHYKPLLVLDYLKEDLIGWVKQGVGIQILQASDLVSALNTGLNVPKAKYDEFVERHFFQLDGNADERIKEFVNTHLNR